jgi:hypothetical protein
VTWAVPLTLPLVAVTVQGPPAVAPAVNSPCALMRRSGTIGGSCLLVPRERTKATKASFYYVPVPPTLTVWVV